MKQCDGLDSGNDRKITLPPHLGAFILSKSNRILDDSIGGANQFYNNNVYYTDTEILCTEEKHWDVLDKTGLVGSSSWQGKNNLKSGGIFYGSFLAPKIE